jgi:two-component system, NtrC family, sensor kinase
VTFSRKGAKSRTRDRKVRSTRTKAITRVGNGRESRIELEKKLAEALQQQAATSEVLRVISSSPIHVELVFDTIAESARQLCDADFCAVFRFDGQLLHLATLRGVTGEAAEVWRRAFPVAPDRGSAAGRSVLSAATVHIPDVHLDPDYTFGTVATVVTFRSIVAVPMARDGLPIEAITVNRTQPGPFHEREIALLQTFADQAAIAIENARLFEEVQARSRELARSVAELRALGEVSRAVS